MQRVDEKSKKGSNSQEKLNFSQTQEKIIQSQTLVKNENKESFSKHAKESEVTPRTDAVLQNIMNKEEEN